MAKGYCMCACRYVYKNTQHKKKKNKTHICKLLYQLLINNVNPTTVHRQTSFFLQSVTCSTDSSLFSSVLHKYNKNTFLGWIPITRVLVCLECFQFESSRLLLFCSEPQLQSRSMMLCRLGSTIPSRGLWEGSPFQQASISCQHSSSKLGSRSGLAPGDNIDISESETHKST